MCAHFEVARALDMDWRGDGRSSVVLCPCRDRGCVIYRLASVSPNEMELLAVTFGMM